MSYRALVTANPVIRSQRARQLLTDAGIAITTLSIPEAANKAKQIEAVRDVDAYLAGVEYITAEVMDAAPKLKVIARAGVGFESVDLDAACKRNIAVTNTPGANHHTVADYVFGLMLELARHIRVGQRTVKEGRWDRTLGIELRGKTLGIVGFGRIGKEVALRARGFHMNIITYDVYQDTKFAAENGVRFVPIEELLRTSDFVSLNCNVTDQNRGMINRDTIALMKPTAYLMNTARGPLINEDDLYEALKAGKIAGAGLDVLTKEPNPDTPLATLDNVVVTPHNAGSTVEAFEQMAVDATQYVLDILSGKRVAACVNPEIWE